MRYFILILCLVFCAGCPETTDDKKPETPPITPGGNTPVQTTNTRIHDAEIAKAKAVEEGDKVAILQAEKALAMLYMAEAEDEADAYKKQVARLTKEIRQEREDVLAVRCYWFAGIMGLLTFVGIGLAIWLPLFRQRAATFAAACASLAALAIFAAWLIPYLIWIGAGIAILGGVAAVWWSRNHHHLTRGP